MAELNDDLLYHGDINAALRRMMQEGFDVDGERIQGLREMLEELRQAREERLEQYDLGGVYDEVARELTDVLDTERASLDDLANEARASGDERRSEITDEVVTERNLQLDLMPPDLAGQVRALQNYEFTSTEAREKFEELMEKLREQLMQQYVDELADGVENLSGDEMQRMKDMMAELNQMLEQRQRGEDPDFDGFMERFGDFFPEDPQTLDELLEIMAQRMAAAQAMLNSMTPEQRQQLQELSNQLLEDMDLRWQADQLAENLQNAFPNMDWGQQYDFSGQNPMPLGQAQSLFEELGDLDQLENLLQGTANPGALAEVDIERARELLGDQAANSLETHVRSSPDAGGSGAHREPRRALRAHASSHSQDRSASARRPVQEARPGPSRPPRAGAHRRGSRARVLDQALRVRRSVQPPHRADCRNAIRRTGGGTPVRLSPEDFEVERTEHLVRSSTVLMLDLSLSMPMRDNFLPAKKVAMALHSLMSTQFPRDYLGIVGFSEVARPIEPHELPEVSWDFVYGTNMQHAFMLSRQLLGRQSGTKQIIMITDGEPTAHIDAAGTRTSATRPLERRSTRRWRRSWRVLERGFGSTRSCSMPRPRSRTSSSE